MLEGGAVKAIVNTARFFLPAALERRRRAALESKLRPLLSSADSGRLLDQLTRDQRIALNEFFGSSQFEQIALHVSLAIYNGAKADDLAATREQIREMLRLRLRSNALLFEATELVYNFTLEAASEVQASLNLRHQARDNPELIATMGRLTAAAAATSELLKGFRDLGRVDQFAQDLRSQVKANYGAMKLPHIGLSRSVPYSKLYVSPYLIRGDHATEVEQSAQTVAEVAGANIRFVVVGDPGAGKSTFSAKLAFDIAADKILAIRNRVPFLVILRNHTEALRRSQRVSLVEYLQASCGDPHHLFPAREDVEYLLLSGTAIVILDGVDELGDSATRRRLAGLVEGFASRYPLCQVVVTSRAVGYSEAPLDAGQFPLFVMAEFTDDQVEEYAHKWFTSGRSSAQPQSDDLAQSFLMESASVAPELRTNPLLLALLCGMYASRHYLPRNKPEIYEKCAEMLFEQWDKSRGVDVPLRFSADIRPAVQQLAWRLLTDNEGRVALPRSEILRFLTDYLQKKRYEDRDEAKQAAGEFLDFCAGRAWALSELGKGSADKLYGFTHRTFLEYFAASQLVRQGPSAGEVWSVIGGKLDDSSWREVAFISAQILDRTVEDGANDLIKLALRGRVNAYRAKVDVEFVSRMLEFHTPAPRLLRQLAVKAASLTFSNNSMPTRRLLFDGPKLERVVGLDEALFGLLRTPNECKSRALEAVREEVRHRVDKGDWCENAAAALCGYATNIRSKPFLPADLTYLFPDSHLSANVQKWLDFLDIKKPIDVQAYGLERYFTGLVFFNRVLPSYVAMLSGHPLPKEEGEEDGRDGSGHAGALRDVESRFEEFYDILISLKTPWLPGYGKSPIFSNSTVLDDLCSHLSEKAFAGLLLAKLPLMEASIDAPHNSMGERSEVFVNLARARTIESNGPEDVQFLTRLRIPQEARRLVTAWVKGDLSATMGMRR